MKKGFTLIELIAVIVVLAIITLIAVPIMSKVVDKARKGAAEASALNYIDAVEKYVILHDLDSTKYPYDLKNNTFNVSSNTEISLLDIIIPKAKAEGTVPSLNSFITVKGRKPSSGTVTTNEKGKVTDADLTIGNYSVECENYSCEAKGGSSTPQVTLSIDTPDSTDLNVSETLTLTVTTNSSDGVTWSSSDDTIATVSSEGVVTGVNTGSVTITATIGSVSDTIELTIKGGPTADLSDIYSSANVKQLGVKGIVYLNPTSGHLYDVCNSSNTTAGPVVRNNVIDTNRCMKWYIYAEDTTNNTYTMILDHNIQNGDRWASYLTEYSNSEVKQFVDDLPWDSAIIEKRLISINELYSITGVEGGYFDGSRNSGIGTSKYAWLYDYTSSCTSFGCNVSVDISNAEAYWTGNKNQSGGMTCVHCVDYTGYYSCRSANDKITGIRPVIVVPKDIFAN